MTSKLASRNKIPYFFHDISPMFKFQDFSMHRFFSAIFQVFHTHGDPENVFDGLPVKISIQMMHTE